MNRFALPLQSLLRPTACSFALLLFGTAIAHATAGFDLGTTHATLRLDAAVYDANTTGAHSVVRLHWGEFWARNNVSMLNRLMLPHLVAGAANYDHGPNTASRDRLRFQLPGRGAWAKIFMTRAA